MSERWHSVEEVADHLGIAQDTVRRWIESRALPAHRLGKLWKFRLSEVDEWVKVSGAHKPQEGSVAAGPARGSAAASPRRAGVKSGGRR